MNGERQTILGMIAAGRITPREGERLLAVASNADERWAWLAVCGAAMWVAAAHADVLAQAMALCVRWIGGVR